MSIRPTSGTMRFLIQALTLWAVSTLPVRAQFGLGLGSYSPLGSDDGSLMSRSGLSNLIRSASPFSSFGGSSYESPESPESSSYAAPTGDDSASAGAGADTGPQRPMQWSPSQQGQMSGPSADSYAANQGGGYDDQMRGAYQPEGGNQRTQQYYQTNNNQQHYNPRRPISSNIDDDADDDDIDDVAPRAGARSSSYHPSARSHNAMGADEDDRAEPLNYNQGISDIGTAASRPPNDESYDSADDQDDTNNVNNDDRPPAAMRGTDQFGASPMNKGDNYGQAYGVQDQGNNNRRQGYGGGGGGYGFADPSAMGLDLSGMSQANYSPMGGAQLIPIGGMQQMGGGGGNGGSGRRAKSASAPMQQMGYYGMSPYGQPIMGQAPRQQQQSNVDNDNNDVDNFNNDDDDD